jgi:hypothetical protein
VPHGAASQAEGKTAMRYYRKTNSSPRTMIAKYAGKCHCCGIAIKAGETIDYYPSLRAIAHVGGLDGNSSRCASEIRQKMERDYTDVDTAYEDQCAEICGK